MGFRRGWDAGESLGGAGGCGKLLSQSAAVIRAQAELLVSVWMYKAFPHPFTGVLKEQR